MKHMKNNGAITVTNLTKRFGQFVAVDTISFEVNKGEFFGFLGPNRAGKTTTIRMLTGIIGQSDWLHFSSYLFHRHNQICHRARQLSAAFPTVTIGAMMLLVGVELVRFAKDIRLTKDLVPMAGTVIVSLGINMAFGFLTGLLIYHVAEFLFE